MPIEHSGEVKFAIRHFLFIDIGGYLNLLVNDENDNIQKPKQIARGIEYFRAAARSFFALNTL